MPTPTYVQSAVSDTTTPITATFSGTTVAGNTYVVVAGIDNPGAFSSISDTEGGNTYTLVAGPTASPDNSVIQYIWVVQNVRGGTLNAITVNTTGGGVTSLCTMELSSCAYLDQVAQQGQNTNSSPDGVTSQSVTTRVATEIILGLGSTKSSQNGFTITGTGYTNIQRGTQEAEYKNVSSIGTYAATSATGAATSCVMGILTFAAAAPVAQSGVIGGIF